MLFAKIIPFHRTKSGYHFKGTKVQKYLQKHAISSKKALPTYKTSIF